MDLPVSQYDAGWNFLNTYFPKYKTYEYDSDPWTLIGLAAAQNGNRVLAEDMQIKTVSGHNAGKAIPINNWSFYRRISLQLQKGINY
ncbi:MAG: hypothetical protein H7336_14945 [Bacteriovorax sp.]|nr:hypothetical protein [Bacteriovorax sp.]